MRDNKNHGRVNMPPNLHPQDEPKFTMIMEAKRQLSEPIIEESTNYEDEDDDDDEVNTLNTQDTQEDRQRTFSELKAFSESFKNDPSFDSASENDDTPTNIQQQPQPKQQELSAEEEERLKTLNDLKAFSDSFRKVQPPKPVPEEEVVFQKDSMESEDSNSNNNKYKSSSDDDDVDVTENNDSDDDDDEEDDSINDSSTYFQHDANNSQNDEENHTEEKKDKEDDADTTNDNNTPRQSNKTASSILKTTEPSSFQDSDEEDDSDNDTPKESNNMNHKQQQHRETEPKRRSRSFDTEQDSDDDEPPKPQTPRERRTYRSYPESNEEIHNGSSRKKKQQQPPQQQQSLVVRLFLDGDDRFCRRVNLNRIFDNDDEILNQILDDDNDASDNDSDDYNSRNNVLSSIQKLKNVAAATFKIHSAEIALSSRSNEKMSLIIDDSDLVEAFREARGISSSTTTTPTKSPGDGDNNSINSATTLTCDIFVTQTIQQAVFINVQLPDSEDDFRLIDMERILNSNRQPSLQRLRSILLPTLQQSSTRPSRSIRFAYARSPDSRFLLHNDFDFDDAVASCSENEVVIQAFYADHEHSERTKRHHHEDEESLAEQQQKTQEILERLDKFEQLVGQQTKMFITTQTQIRTLEENRERKHAELKDLIAEVDERTSGDGELLDRLEKALSATLHKIQEMKLESLAERVEKIEEQISETLPRLEVAAVGAINATKDLDARVKRQNSNKIEFVGKERLQAVEEKVGQLTESLTKMTEESEHIGMEEEQAAHELGERLRNIETSLREQQQQQSKNGKTRYSNSGMSERERQEILTRLDTLEDSVAIIRGALDSGDTGDASITKTAPPDDSSVNNNEGNVVATSLDGEMV